MSTPSERRRQVKTAQPKRNMTARDSNGGITKVCIASDGHLAHSGIAKAPTHVHVFGERVECLTDGELSSPNTRVVPGMYVDAYLRSRFQSGLLYMPKGWRSPTKGT